MSGELKDKGDIIGGDRDNNLMFGSVERSTRVSIGSSLTSDSGSIFFWLWLGLLNIGLTVVCLRCIKV